MTEPFGGYTPPPGHKSADERHDQPAQGNHLRAFRKAAEADGRKCGSATPEEVAYAASKLGFRKSGRVKILLALLGMRRRPKRFRR